MIAQTKKPTVSEIFCSPPGTLPENIQVGGLNSSPWARGIYGLPKKVQRVNPGGYAYIIYLKL